MSDYAFCETLLSGMSGPEGDRQVLKAVLKYTLQDCRFGPASPASAGGVVSKNFGGGFFSAKTPSTANQEFSIVHGFGRVPYLLIPVLPLDTVNAACVRLTISRAADVSRIYLKSPDTSQPINVYIEG